MRVTFICTILLLSISNLSAQVTLDDYRSAVIEYSHQIAIGQATINGSVAELSRRRKGYLPMLTVERTATYQSDAEGRNWNWMMQPVITQPIYVGGATRAAVRQAELSLDISQSNLEQTEREVQYEAEVAYWSLSRAQIYQQAIADYLAIVASLEEIVARRFAEGYTSKSDLLQVESRLSDAQYQLSAAEQSYLIALHHFNTLRGMKATEEVVLHNTILDSMIMPQRCTMEDILRFNPEYRASMAQKESARWGIKAAGAKFLPNISLKVYGTMEPNRPHIAGGGTNYYGGAILSLSSPIFHFRERRDAMNVARSEHRISELATAELRDQLSLDESNGWTNLQNSYSRVKATQRNLRIAQENLNISTYAYNEGTATILDVLQAQMSWLQIYTNTITAQYDYAIAIAAYLLITNYGER